MEEVAAEVVAQTTTIPTITQRQTIEITLNSDDSSAYYDDCIYYESYLPISYNALNEIYIGYCGTEPQPIVSGLRFNTSVLEDIPFEDITDIYIVVAVEKGAYTSDALAPIAIRGHATIDSQTFANGAWPLGRTNLTTASASWVMTPWGNDLPDSDYHSGFGRVETPSLLPIVQEMYTTIGWELGNPLTFIFKPTGATPSTNIHRRFIATERLTGAHARLVVEYDAPATVANSYYLQTLERNNLAEVACHLANSLKNGNSSIPTALVTLVVGKPSDIYPNKLLINAGTEEYATYAQTYQALRHFAYSYAICARNEGINTQLTIAIASQNFGSNINYDTGVLWAHLVHSLRSNTKAIRYVYVPFRKVDFVAASDLETGWNTPEATLDWLDGALSYHQPFISVASVAFPDMQLSVPIEIATERAKVFSTGEFTWTIGDVLDMTYGKSPRIYSLPQVYLRNADNARQWYYLAILTNQLGDVPLFEAALTQYGSCQQKDFTSYSCPTDDNGTDNTPYQAWQQLIDLNNSHPTFPNQLTLVHLTDICSSVEGLNNCGFPTANPNP